MLCADENFSPWIDICAIQINKYYYYYYVAYTQTDRSDKQNEMNRDEDYLWHECNGTNKLTNRLRTKKCNQHLLNEVKRRNTK